MKNYRKSCAICETGEALCELFHRETSLTKKSAVAFSSHIARAFADDCFLEANTKQQQGKLANKHAAIALNPIKDNQLNANIFNVMQNRISTRAFSKDAVSFAKLSTILKFAYGRSSHGTYTVPSAGGNYPVRLVIIVNNVTELASGIYEYRPEDLTLLPWEITASKVMYTNLTQSMSLTKNCAFSIHFTASLDLMCYKYQDRGYRFMNIECGHIAQNISLISEALEVGAVCSGGFMDGEFINEMNKLNTGELSDYVELYEMFLGNKISC